MNVARLGLVALALSGASAMAQTPCPTPEALLGAAVTLREAFPESAPLVKGEFETTAQFEARKASQSLPERVLLQVPATQGNYVYDADRQVFRILQSVFAPRVFLGSLTYDEARRDFFGDPIRGYLDPLSLSLDSRIEGKGSYEAENAFGAKVTVERKDREEDIVFEHRGRRRANAMDTPFAEHDDFKSKFLEFPVPIATAPELKPKLRTVVLVKPTEPGLTHLTDRIAPTRDTPIEADLTYNVLIGDIQCVGVRDGQGQLIASWATR